MSIARIVISCEKVRSPAFRRKRSVSRHEFAADACGLKAGLRTFLLFQNFSRKKVNTYGSEVRRRKLRLESLVWLQSRLSRAGEEDVKLDEILVGKAVSGVVGHGQRPVEIGAGHLRRQSMKLHHEQSESPHVWSPAAKVSNQILFQFIGWNLLAQVREGAARSSLPRPTNVIGRRKIGAIVIQKGADVQQVMNVQTQSLQFARQMRRTVDVALNDMEIGNARSTQPLFADAPRDLADIGADQNQRTSVERGPSHRLLLDDGVNMREQRAVAAPHVAYAQGLLI